MYSLCVLKMRVLIFADKIMRFNLDDTLAGVSADDLVCWAMSDYDDTFNCAQVIGWYVLFGWDV